MNDRNKSMVAQEERRLPAETAARAAMLPPVDILEDESGITVFADLPGVSKDRLNVRIDGETLFIEGEARVTAPEHMEQVYSEVRVPFFRRSFALSRELDPDGVEASIKDGVLKLHIAKREEARPRRINVNVA